MFPCLEYTHTCNNYPFKATVTHARKASAVTQQKQRPRNICVNLAGFQVNGEFARVAPRIHVTGGAAHTCALICSTVGGLILSHYHWSAAGAMALPCVAARMSVLPLDQAGGVFHQGLSPPVQRPEKKSIKKTKLLSWALAKCAGLSVWVVKEIKRTLYYSPSPPHPSPPLLVLPPPLWMRKWPGLGNGRGNGI